MLFGILKYVVAPAVAGVLGFLFADRLTMWRDRRRKSLLGAAVCGEIMEELQTGVRIMEAFLGVIEPGASPPRKTWSGMSTLSDEVLERLVQLSKTRCYNGFPISEIRTHLKNYFDHICPNFDAVVVNVTGGKQLTETGRMSAIHGLVEPAKGVLVMIERAKKVLENNSSKWFPE